MIEAAVPCHKSQAVFHIPEENYLGSFAPSCEPAAEKDLSRDVLYPFRAGRREKMQPSTGRRTATSML